MRHTIDRDRTLRLTIGPSAFMHCEVDDATDPWTEPDTIIALHGIAEDGGLWRPWSPWLARRHRLLRPDLRGFGRSSELPEGPFSITTWADDIERLVDTTGSSRVHLLATKLGSQLAFLLAERRPRWLASMTLAGMLPSPRAALAPWLDDWVGLIRREGVKAWAQATMPGRMGGSLSADAMRWWTESMGSAPARSVIATLSALADIDGPMHPEHVACPTLFLLATQPTAEIPATFDQRPAAADLLRLKARVPDARVAEVAADSFHIAATHPDACARLVAAFIDGLAEARGPA